MADTLSMSTKTSWHLPARTAQDYCREIAEFLRVNPTAWTQGVTARGGDGCPMSSSSPFARSFCALGLLERFMGHSDVIRFTGLSLLSKALARLTGDFIPIHHYNDEDGRRVEDIVAVFEMAATIPCSEPIEPDVYQCMADAYYAKVRRAAKLKKLNWAKSVANPYLVDPDEAISVEDANAEVAAKLVPWAVIERQIKASLAASCSA